MRRVNVQRQRIAACLGSLPVSLDLSAHEAAFASLAEGSLSNSIVYYRRLRISVYKSVSDDSPNKICPHFQPCSCRLEHCSSPFKTGRTFKIISQAQWEVAHDCTAQPAARVYVDPPWGHIYPCAPQQHLMPPGSRLSHPAHSEACRPSQPMNYPRLLDRLCHLANWLVPI